MAQKPSYDQLTQRIQELEQDLAKLRAVQSDSQNDFIIRSQSQNRAAALESDERFREIADYSQKVFWLFDLKAQKVIYANSAFERIWGHPVKDLYNQYSVWAESIHPDDLESARKSFNQIIETGGGDPREYRIIRPDGTVRWVSDKGYAIRDNHGKVVRITGVAEDITERKAAEELLKKNNQYLTALHETAIGLIRRHDLNELLRDILTRAASLADTEHGYIYLYDKEEDEFVIRFGMGILKKAINVRVKPGEGLAGKVWSSGQPMSITEYYQWPGRISDSVFDDLRAVVGIPLKSSNKVVGVIGLGHTEENKAFTPEEISVLSRFAELAAIAFDNAQLYAKLGEELSERRKAEESLRQYERIVSTSKDLMALIDRNFIYQAVSDSYLNAHARTRDEIIGMTVADLMGDDRFEKEYRVKMEQCLKGEEVTFRTWFDFKGMGHRYIEATYYPFEDDRDHVSGIVLISRDITEYRQLHEQLLQSQKMEAIGTLAGGIAHDFNNLMMGIQGRTSMMLLDIDKNHPHQEHLKGIEEHIRSASNLTRQLLGFARGGKYEVKPVDLNTIIKEKNRMFGRMQKEIGIEENFAPDLWAVEVDQSQIEQVLLNLYINAWQAMSEEGTLGIQTENTLVTAKVAETHGVKPGRYVKLSVVDTGVGMDAGTRARIFEPFFTTKDIGRGTGLGLASVYGIVQNHGGFITVTSDEGQGTTFEIHLPATDKQIILSDESTEPISTGNGTILLVDDEEMIITVGSQMLRRLGYNVLTATSGKQALEIYNNHEEQVDLVILDVIMPDIGGGETFEMLKSVNPAVKVLLSSGYSINGKASVILERGCRGFLQKPFDLHTLSNKIKKIL
jgi:PAS domain S-box-containing protein